MDAFSAQPSVGARDRHPVDARCGRRGTPGRALPGAALLRGHARAGGGDGAPPRDQEHLASARRISSRRVRAPPRLRRRGHGRRLRAGRLGRALPPLRTSPDLDGDDPLHRPGRGRAPRPHVHVDARSPRDPRHREAARAEAAAHSLCADRARDARLAAARGVRSRGSGSARSRRDRLCRVAPRLEALPPARSRRPGLVVSLGIRLDAVPGTLADGPRSRDAPDRRAHALHRRVRGALGRHRDACRDPPWQLSHSARAAGPPPGNGGAPRDGARGPDPGRDDPLGAHGDARRERNGMDSRLADLDRRRAPARAAPGPRREGRNRHQGRRSPRLSSCPALRPVG